MLSTILVPSDTGWCNISRTIVFMKVTFFISEPLNWTEWVFCREEIQSCFPRIKSFVLHCFTPNQLNTLLSPLYLKMVGLSSQKIISIYLYGVCCHRLYFSIFHKDSFLFFFSFFPSLLKKKQELCFFLILFVVVLQFFLHQQQEL